MTPAEKFWFWLAGILPVSLVYFCAIRLGAHATGSKYSTTVVPEITLMEAIERWHRDRVRHDSMCSGCGRGGGWIAGFPAYQRCQVCNKVGSKPVRATDRHKVLVASRAKRSRKP